jgi:hypothetical protein
MQPPTTRYAKSGDIHVAYQVFGEGPDVVVAPGFVSHIENYWDEPRLARWLSKAGTFSRVVMFDKRGTGLSDRVANLPALDERMDDLRAVMDAVGIERATLMGVSEGGSLAALFWNLYGMKNSGNVDLAIHAHQRDRGGRAGAEPFELTKPLLQCGVFRFRGGEVRQTRAAAPVVVDMRNARGDMHSNPAHIVFS